MSLRILLGQVFFTGTLSRFSNDTLSHTGKIMQASTSLRIKSKSSTTEKVMTKRTSSKKAYRAVRSTLDKLKTSYPKKNVQCRKVTIVGSGRAALTSALALVATDTTKDVCMLSLNSSLHVQGEAMDIMHASVFIKDPKIVATKDHADTKGSDICVIAAGTEQGANEDNYEFTSRNSRLIHEVVPELMRYSPEAVYLVAGDPVDVLTREAWVAGGMHQSRIIGTGTNLYSAMLRSLISSRLGVHAASCHGLVLGQNNPCSNPCANSGGVPVWSAATVQGVRLAEVNPEIGTESDPEKWQDSYESMIKDEQVVRRLKGGYNWAAALSIVDICKTILNNSHDIRPVSTYATENGMTLTRKSALVWYANTYPLRHVASRKGKSSVEEDVFLSLPCVLGVGGVVSVAKQPLSAKELFLLRRDSRKVSEMQTQLKIIQKQ